MLDLVFSLLYFLFHTPGTSTRADGRKQMSNETDKHTLTREYAGREEMRSITPVCSCGWRGRAEYAYNDYQHTNVREQESAHSRSALKAGAL
jgi:hypothetical protein